MAEREPRDIVEVIEKMQAEMRGKEGFLNATQRLEHLKTSAKYAAPEMQRSVWDRVLTVLEEELGDPAGNPVKLKVQAIFAAKD